MLRRLVATVLAGCLAVVTFSACARHGAETTKSAADWPAGVKEAEVYIEVLHRYLGSPGENSFPAGTFKTVYVLDTDILPSTQQQIADKVKYVKFVSNKDSVIETVNGCGQVKGGGILITLGTVEGDDNEVHVAVSGFVACLGATWLTYVVKNLDGAGWQVTGTTGASAIA